MRLAFLLATTFVLTACRRLPDTPLTRAAAQGTLPGVMAVLATHADPNEGDGHGWAPLHWAARNGNTEVISALLRAGAKVDLPDHGGNGWTPLLHAIHKHRTAAVRLLLDAGADPNGRRPDTATPLMFGAAYGDTEIVQELLARGADPYVRVAGTTALANAAGEGGLFDITDGPPLGTCHVATVKALLARAPDLPLEQSALTRSLVNLRHSKGCDEVASILERRGRS